MKGTDNDLSFNKVTLDMAAVERCVGIAYGSLVNRIRRDAEKLLDSVGTDKDISCITAKALSNDSAMLVDVAETLHTIRGTSKRELLELVNKREVKEEFKGDEFPKLKKKKEVK